MYIYLRPIRLEDGPQIVRWRNDEKIREHCMNNNPITIESNAAFFEANIKTGKYKQFIVEYVEPQSGAAVFPIATVYLKDMDYNNKRCELCIFTSSDSEWDSECQSIAIKQLIEKAFDEYGMHKLYSYVFAKYPDEIELLKSAGFIEEVILRKEACNKDGLYEDIVRMCIFNE